MMYGNWPMMSSGMMSGAWGFGFLTWLVVFVDLVLLGMWLWKQVNK